MVRVAGALLLGLALVLLAACGGEDEAGPPAPLSQRVVTAEDAPGSKPDPVETGQMTTDFDEFIDTLGELAVDPDREEMTEVFREAGFEAAIADVRFFGETHSMDALHVFSSAIRLGSDDGAQSALEWIAADSVKPCPMTCAVRINEFDVDGVPDGRGVHRSQSAEDIEAVGDKQRDVPFDSYEVSFADGRYVYTVDYHGPPGSVTEDEAEDVFRAFYERVSDLPGDD